MSRSTHILTDELTSQEILHFLVEFHDFRGNQVIEEIDDNAWQLTRVAAQWSYEVRYDYTMVCPVTRAYYTIKDDEKDNNNFIDHVVEEVVHANGHDNYPLIVVHADTSTESNFIPFVRALRFAQTKAGLPLVRVYVHKGEVDSLHEVTPEVQLTS